MYLSRPRETYRCQHLYRSRPVPGPPAAPAASGTRPHSTVWRMSAYPEPSGDTLDEVVDTRRHLHRNPEVSFEEDETSRFIEERLRSLGLAVQECPTRTGGLAVLDSGRPGRTVMLRADIDALPILEESG